MRISDFFQCGQFKSWVIMGSSYAAERQCRRESGIRTFDERINRRSARTTASSDSFWPGNPASASASASATSSASRSKTIEKIKVASASVAMAGGALSFGDGKGIIVICSSYSVTKTKPDLVNLFSGAESRTIVLKLVEVGGDLETSRKFFESAARLIEAARLRLIIAGSAA
jgi:hypothetical protein